MALIVDAIARRRTASGGAGPARVLEFGCGDGTQTPFLARFGPVVSSDIVRPAHRPAPPAMTLVRADLSRAPFASETFGVVFSNHVMEHIDDLAGALDELRRIGARDCVYAISVPTHVWLLLSIPSGYRNAALGLASRVRRRVTGAPPDDGGKASTTPRAPPDVHELARHLVPRGHGTEEHFMACLARFRPARWRELFTSAGFVVDDEVPLLLYAPSEWPVIPTMRPIRGVCSSVLFLMHRA